MSSALPTPNPSPDPLSGVVTTDVVYAFTGVGTFVMEAGFKTVAVLDQDTLLTYDVTQALQINIPASMFNAKLGITSLSNSYDDIQQTFVVGGAVVDSITIAPDDFKAKLLSPTQIVRAGAYLGMYAKFRTYVATYFGVPGGFASLFAGATLFDPVETSTDAENIYALFNPTAGAEMTIETEPEGADLDTYTGNYTTAFTGEIVISNITKLLRYAVDSNVVGNRASPVIGDGAADDTANTSNFGVGDGFLPGDLIYVSPGTQITLDLDISPELYSPPFNNPNDSVASTFVFGENNVADLTVASNSFPTLSSTSTAGDYSSASTITRTNIKRVLKAPLLIILTVDPP